MAKLPHQGPVGTPAMDVLRNVRIPKGPRAPAESKFIPERKQAERPVGSFKHLGDGRP